MRRWYPLSVDEAADEPDERLRMGVVRRVPSALDDGDPAVKEPRVEGRGRVREDAQAVATEDLEDRLADGTEPLERRCRIGLGLELAQDGAGSGGADRPDRVRVVGVEIGWRHPDDLAQERGEGSVAVPGGEQRAEPIFDAGRVV